MKVYLTDPFSYDHYDFHVEKELFKDSGIELILANCRTEEDVVEQCSDADGILDIYTKIGPTVMDGLPNLKVVVRYGVGFDTIDVPEATKRGIKVVNIPFYCIEEVAVHTTALVLAVTRNLFSYTQNIRNNDYSLEGYPSYVTLRSPRVRTVGFLGFGKLPRRCSQNLYACGYNIMAYDPFLPDSVFEEYHAKKATMDEVLEQADIITPNVPLNPETYHFVNRESIAKMKDGVLIVNTGRGALIDEEALIEALQSGKVAGAGLDVFEGDHLKPDHPFFKMDNVILTPHAAFKTEESFLELCRQSASCMLTLLKGEDDSQVSIVNRKQLGL